MRVGICLNMVARDARGLGMEYLSDIASCGFDFAEISAMQVMRLDRQEFTREVCRPLQDSGLRCHAMNAFCGTEFRFADPQDAPRVLAYTHELLERAAALGAHMIVIGAGVARSIAPGETMQQACTQMTTLFCAMADLAAPYGVTLALEGLNRQETNMYDCMPRVIAQVEACAHPNLGALVDYFHFSLGNESPQILPAMAPQIRHVHLARVLSRRLPCDVREDEGYVPFLRALGMGGYDGALSLEATCAPGAFLPQAAQALSVVRSLCAEAGL
jgi:D-psicose/D-tagatose/L-ribulose 3-epimerase